MSDNRRRSIVEWNEDEVQQWLSSLGIPQYENHIKEHRISGEVLCMLDPESLKDVGVATIGQRITILKAIYQAKVAFNIPINSDDYVPPSEIAERPTLTLDSLHGLVTNQEDRIRVLEDENRHLNNILQSFLDDYHNFRGTSRSVDETPLASTSSPRWDRSPTKVDSPRSNPASSPAANDTPPTRALPQQPHLTPPSRAPVAQTPSFEAPTPLSVPTKPARQDSSENLNKSFKVSLEDPTYKVLPAALKKYRINNDNWESYAMFICYGPQGNRIERCLSYDEKPLLLFQKLKDAKKNPVFMLKHIKDIRSPIVVAQQKHAARKANSLMSADGNASTTSNTANKSATSGSRTPHRPPKLEVHDLSAATPLPGLSPQPGWPDAGMQSPSGEHSRGEDLLAPPVSAGMQSHLSPGSSSGASVTGGIMGGGPSESQSSSREMPPAHATGVSYAIAIYPYMAEQDDEFDVIVGDTFVIQSRSRGWWVVQRDSTGSGNVEQNARQGWVPAGCLLETNSPVAAAISEAQAAKQGSNSPTTSRSTPILPTSIVSTSFPGIALMGYTRKGEEELDLAKDDSLRVFKRYNHWSYAVKESSGDRGWVPSWFIGKVASSNGNVPPTPNITFSPTGQLLAEEVNGLTQVSPMSSAFPAVSR